MRDMRWFAAAGLGLSLFLTACGGSISTTIPPVTTYVLTVNSTSPASGVAITVSPADTSGAANGATSFSRTYDAGTAVTLTAPAQSGGNTFSSWSGCTSTSTVTCTVAMNANATVTAKYAIPALITPTVTVTPSASSITTAQPLTVTVAVSGGSGNPTPTGSVTLTSGSYTSAAVMLAGGSATINVAAGSLATGSDTLTVAYTPDSASSSVYNSASGTSSLTVAAASTYVLTVNSTDPSSGVTIEVTYPPTTLATQGTTSFTVSGTAGETLGLTAPSIANGNNFSSWTGCATASTVNCTVTLNGNITVTANYTAAKTTPTVTVTPSVASVTTAQGLTVTVGVSGGGGNPTPTGSVTLTGGNYTSTAATLSGGSATINIAAGALAVGSDTLTASYTPDAGSSAIYTSATGTAPVTVTAVTAYTLTIDSTAPSSGVDIQAIPSDNNGNGYGPTPLTLTYNSGTAVALTASAKSGGYGFVSWTGCATSSTETCNVTMNANTTVTANYNQPTITSITVTPSAATIGSQVQLKATVAGTGAYTSGVTWTLSCPVCGSLSAGTLTAAGLYTTPYPAPASVTVTATSTMSGYTNVSGSATVALSAPATAAGPALTVDLGNKTHAISPDIYGMDAYLLDATTAEKANLAIDRWGGDSTERYNYELDVTSSIDDWYFENQTGNGGDGLAAVSGVKAFDALVERNAANGIKTLGTVPVLGWVAKDDSSCSFPVSLYPGQESVDQGRQCGNGVYPDGVNGCTSSGGCNITGNSPTLTSIAEPPPAPPVASAVNAAWADATWTGSWVEYLVGKFGPGSANNGTSGVAVYDLDNEPSWWDSGSRDVHPLPATYDEMTEGGIGTALAIKTVDPTAEVSGPVMDYWWDYFYSKKDIENGWDNGSPCWQPWSNPIDRKAHGGVPFIEYYLQQMAAAETTYGVRLLDYVDLHTYFAPQYPTNSGDSVAFTTAGDTGRQQARLNSTRVFWDSTYTDPDTDVAPAYGGFQQPNYITDLNYTPGCTVPAQAPQLIQMMKNWVASDYPGTKLAIDEYNWGGMEAINGALAQADILGIFGREGLDLGTLWPTTNPSQQVPGTMAFAMYRNYDGNKSTFGDTALASTSTNSSKADGEGQLAVYGALRSSDKAITVMVINKTYGSLTSTIGLENFTAASNTTAQVYQYTSADLTAINQLTAVSVTQPASGGTTSTISSYSFPAQSITLFVVPQ